MADLHHEIRSPLNIILNTAELGLMESPTPSIKRYLKTIEKFATSLLALMDDIIRLSSEEKCGGSPAPFFLISLLEEIRDIIDASMQANSVRMILDIRDETSESFQGPRARIRQVLIRILDFAIRRFRPGQISLSLGYSPAKGSCLR